MFYETWGRGGETLVGLHGWGGDHSTFAPLVPHMPRNVRLVACDLPGYGRTPAPLRFTREGLSHDIARWIDGLDAPEISLVGNCSGALAALLCAPLLKTRITRLILLDAFAYVPWYFRVFSNRLFGDYAYYSTFANPLGRRLANLGLARNREAGTDMTSSFAQVNHAATLAWLRVMADIPGYEYFRGVNAPVELVHGARTFAAVKRSISLWKRLWPRAPVTVLQGAGHLGIAEAPSELASVIFKSSNPREAALPALSLF